MEAHGGKILTGQKSICLSELSGSPTNCHLVTKQEELAKEITNFTYEVSFIF
jgi:hypothetical protein